MESISLNFTSRPIKEWNSIFNSLEPSNCFQSWPFCTGVFKTDRIPSKLASIERNKKIIGAVIIQEIKLGFISTMQIHRGPIWSAGENTPQNFNQFCAALSKLYPSGLFTRRRWLIEMDQTAPDVNQALQTLQEYGWKKKSGSFETSVVDLRQTESELFKKLKSKFRNQLRRSEILCQEKGMELKLILNPSENLINEFLKRYETYRKSKSFHGSSAAFFKAEINEGLLSDQIFFAVALHKGEPIAGMYFLKSGQTFNYRLGFNSELGRSTYIHYLMIWKSALFAKAFGANYFDLGGLLLNESKNLHYFKRGLGGKTVQLLGIFG